MIRWSIFYKDNPIHITTIDEKEDERIANAMGIPDTLLFVQGGEGTTIFLNLREALFIMRKVLTEEEIKAATAPITEPTEKDD